MGEEMGDLEGPNRGELPSAAGPMHEDDDGASPGVVSGSGVPASVPATDEDGGASPGVVSGSGVPASVPATDEDGGASPGAYSGSGVPASVPATDDDGGASPEAVSADDGAAPEPTPARQFEDQMVCVDSLVEAVRGFEQIEAQIHVIRARTIAALHEVIRKGAVNRIGVAEAVSVTAAEIAAALNVSARTGRAMVDEALTLTDRTSFL